MKLLSRHFLYMAVLLIPSLIYHGRILVGGEILCGGDMISQFVPWREFAFHELSQGRFPVWNPYVFCGTPFAANIQTSLFYPLNLLNLFFSVERTFSLSLVVHHLLSLAAMYLFLYKLWGNRIGAVIGSMVYGWSGFFITHGHDGHLIHIRAYALVPLALYAQTCWRYQLTAGSFLLFCCSLAGLFYAGHTQIPLYIFYLLLFRSLWWGINRYYENRHFFSSIRLMQWTLIGLVFSAGLASFVLVPLFELSQETAGRAGGADYEFATSDSMPPQHIITLFSPFFYGSPMSDTREGQFWETRTGYHEICGYMGILPWLLALMVFVPLQQTASSQLESHDKTEVRFFVLLTLAGIVFALGHYTPLYSILYNGLPGWKFFRVPGRMLLFSILGLSVLSARGWIHWQQADGAKIFQSRAGKIAVLLSLIWIFCTVILILSKPAILHTLREFEIDRTISEYQLWLADRSVISNQLPAVLFETRYAWMLYSCLLTSALLVIGWICLFACKWFHPKYLWILPVLVLGADFWFFARPFMETLPPDQWKKTFFPDSALTRFLKNNVGNSRILCLDDAIGYPTIQYHPELRPNRLMHYGIATVRGYDPLILKSYTRWVNKIFNQPPETPQGGLLFFPTVPNKNALDLLGVKYILTTQKVPELYRPVWSDDQSKLTIYENPKSKSIVQLLKVSPGMSTQILARTPSSIQIEVNTPVPNQLIFSQTAYSGWCVANPQPSIRFHRYQDTFLSVDVPAGKHVVVLKISFLSLAPFSSFVLGMIITFGGVVGVTLLSLFLKSRNISV